ncbi:unnamed protein product [Phytomonas sp. Hart1]|nr:unnamed protein product [Phytomonas sp. Hart1]|eukprot:CCW71888.1 unnamed protein product [Phytomonas sp. isolate Hart1]
MATMPSRMAHALEVCEQLLLYGATASGHFDANGLDSWMLAVSIDGYAGERATTLLLDCHKKNHNQIGIQEGQVNYPELFQRWQQHNFGLSLNVMSMLSMPRFKMRSVTLSNDSMYTLIHQTDTSSLLMKREGSIPGCNPLGFSKPEKHLLPVKSHTVQTTGTAPLGMSQDFQSNLESKPNAKTMVFSPLGSKLFNSNESQLKNLVTASELGDTVCTPNNPYEDLNLQHYYHVMLLFITAEHNPSQLKNILKEIKRVRSTKGYNAIPIVHPITQDTLLTFILKKAYRHSLFLSRGLQQHRSQNQTNTQEGEPSILDKSLSFLSESFKSQKGLTQGASSDCLPQAPPHTLSLHSVQPLLRVTMTIINLMETHELYHNAGDGETALSLAALIGYMSLVRQLVLVRPLCAESSKWYPDSASLKKAVNPEVGEGEHLSTQTEGESNLSIHQYIRQLLISNLSHSSVCSNIATRLYFDESDGEILFTILSCIPTEAGEGDLINFLTMVYANLHPIIGLQLAANYTPYVKYFLTAPACMNAFWVNLLYAQYAGRLGELGITTAKWDLLIHTLLPGAPAVAVYLIQKKSPVLENPMNTIQGTLQGEQHHFEGGVETAKSPVFPSKYLKGSCNKKSAMLTRGKRLNSVPLNPWKYISSRISLLLQMMALTAADTLLVKPTTRRSLSKFTVPTEVATPPLSANNSKTHYHSYEKDPTSHSSTAPQAQNSPKKGLRANARDLAPQAPSLQRNESAKGGISFGQQSGVGGNVENVSACGWANTLLGDVAELAVRYDNVDVFLDLVRLRIPQQTKKMLSKQRTQDQSQVGSRQGRHGNDGASTSVPRSLFSEPWFIESLTAASAYCPSLATIHSTYQLNNVLDKLQAALWRDIIEDKHIDILAAAAGSINLLQYLYDCHEKEDVEEDKCVAVFRQYISPLRYDRIDMLTGLPEGIPPSPSKLMETSPRVGANATFPITVSTLNTSPKTVEPPHRSDILSNTSFILKQSTPHRILGENSTGSASGVSKEGITMNTFPSKDSPPPAISQCISISGYSSRPDSTSFKGARSGIPGGELPDDDDAYNSSRWVSNFELKADFAKRHQVMAVMWGTGTTAKMLEYGSGQSKGFASVAASLLDLSAPPCSVDEEFQRSSMMPTNQLVPPSQQKGGNALQHIDLPGHPDQLQSQQASHLITPNHTPKWFMYLIGDWCLHSSLVLHSPYPSLVTLDVLEFFLNRRAPLSLSVLQLFLKGTWFSSSASNEQSDGWWCHSYGQHTRKGQPLTIHYQSPAHGDTLLHILVINNQCELAEFYLAYCLYYFVRSGLDSPLPPAYRNCVLALFREVESIKGVSVVRKGAHGKVPLPVHFLQAMLRRNAHGLTPIDYAHNPGMVYLLYSYGCVPPTYHLHPQRFSQCLGFNTSSTIPRIDTGDYTHSEGKGRRANFAEVSHTSYGSDVSRECKMAYLIREERKGDFFPIPRLVLISEDLLSYHDNPSSEIFNDLTNDMQGSNSSVMETSRQYSRFNKNASGGNTTRAASLSVTRAQTEVSDSTLLRSLLASQRLTNDFMKLIIPSDNVSLLHIGLCSGDDELVREYCALRKRAFDSNMGDCNAIEKSLNSMHSSKVVIGESKVTTNAAGHDVAQPPPINRILYFLPPLSGMESYLKLKTSVSNSALNGCENNEIGEMTDSMESKRRISVGRKMSKRYSQLYERRATVSTTTNPKAGSIQFHSNENSKHASCILPDFLNSLEKHSFIVYPLSLQLVHSSFANVLSSPQRPGSKRKPKATSSNIFFSKIQSVYRNLMLLSTAEEGKSLLHKPERGPVEGASLLIALTPMQLAMASGAIRRATTAAPASPREADEQRGHSSSSFGTPSQQYQSVLLRPLTSREKSRRAVGEGGGGQVVSATVQPPPFSPHAGADVAAALDLWTANERTKLSRGRTAAGRHPPPTTASADGDGSTVGSIAPKGGVTVAEQQRLMGLLLRELDRCLGVERIKKDVELAICPNYDIDTVGDAVAAARKLKTKRDSHHKSR